MEQCRHLVTDRFAAMEGSNARERQRKRHAEQSDVERMSIDKNSDQSVCIVVHLPRVLDLRLLMLANNLMFKENNEMKRRGRKKCQRVVESVNKEKVSKIATYRLWF